MDSEQTLQTPVLKSWDDWFQNCGKLVPDLQKYEKLVLQYFQRQCSHTPEGEQCAQQSYQARHNAKFYEQYPKLPQWMLKKYLKFGGIGGVAGFVIGLLYRVFTSANGIQVSDLLLHSIPFGLVCMLCICGFPGLFHVLRVNGLIKKLEGLEAKIRGRIGYIPPLYRNSQACESFYNLFCTYGVLTFQSAQTSVDEYLTANNLVGLYLAVLSDVPYENPALAGSVRKGDSRVGQVANEQTVNDPNLPDDIASKTYTGAMDADTQLDALVGLNRVKDQVRQMKNRISFYNGSQTEQISGNHMVFLGPPGTGKTTIARIITKILYDYGYIRENKCVEIDGGYLKSPYVGQTTERANAIIRYAMGGVLFIDEAYILAEGSGDAGAEASGVLLKAMEDKRTDFVVIMAGYEDNMNRLLASNEGFSSRIKYKIYFDDFTVEELVQIFKGLMKQQVVDGEHYKIEKSALTLITSHFEKERRVSGFGNARVIRNTWDGLMDIHADHFMKGELPEEKRHIITKQDVQAFIEVRQQQMQEDGRNFIARRNLDSSVVSLQELKGKTKDGAKDPDKSLEQLTGLSVVKDEIARMKAQFSFYDGKMESEGHHMVFLGPPGTGKTTVASIMTGYLYEMGIIQENRYLDINGDFLRGMYVGHTGKRTEAVVQYAQGMVLFIDEAYLLSASGSDNNSFGQEAIGVLLDAMEKYRKNFVVIFAGYEQEMQMFLDMNSGLRSRISMEFHFESYTPHELARMMQSVARHQNPPFKVEKAVWKPLQLYLAKQVESPVFGNGRFIRSLFEECKKTHIMNFASGQYPEEKKYVITLADVQPHISES